MLSLLSDYFPTLSPKVNLVNLSAAGVKNLFTRLRFFPPLEKKSAGYKTSLKSHRVRPSLLFPHLSAAVSEGCPLPGFLHESKIV